MHCLHQLIQAREIIFTSYHIIVCLFRKLPFLDMAANKETIDEFEQYERRKAVVNAIDIDLILAGRVQKISIEVPSLIKPPISGRRLRWFITDNEKMYYHLLGETTGEVYEVTGAGRPELDLFTVRIKESAKFIEANLPDVTAMDLTSSIKILFDPLRCLFILSKRVEDEVILMLYALSDPFDLVIESAICGIRFETFHVINRVKHLIWRRFIRQYFLPIITKKDRIFAADSKIRSGFYKIKAENDDDSSAILSEPRDQGRGIKTPSGKRDKTQNKLGKNKSPNRAQSRQGSPPSKPGSSSRSNRKR